jgi:LytS/YehU family sensor histidine kinase
VQYVEQLSDFFRNIVTYRDKDMISLEEEIGLLQTYFYLQQKRYGNYLQLQINLTGHDEKEIFLPPLTLQLLMENAIKHNAVSKEALLTVQLFAQDDYLVIKNNINIKTNSETGTGMGLQNIINRYAMLTDKKVTVHKTNEYFMVSLPILKQS